MTDSPADTPQPDAANPVPVETRLEEALARADQHRDAMLRAMADADNVRKRAQVDVSNAHKFAAERVLDSLLPVADSLEAALGSPTADAATLRNGVELTLRQLRVVFEKENLKELSPDPGEKFDPNRHQAMVAVEADAEPNTVVAVLQKGYALNDRIVRPALVSVARARTNAGA